MCVSLVPLLLFARRARRNLGVLFAVSLLVNIGMWSERLMIIITSLSHGFEPYAWGVYRPSAIEVTIGFGSVCWFLFWFLLVMGHIPAVPIAETKHGVLERRHG